MMGADVETAGSEPAMSAAEPVTELQFIDEKDLQEAIKLLPSVMRPSLSKVIISAIEEQRRIIAYFKRNSRARQLAFEAATAPPAPSVAVKALQMADETFRDLGWHDKYEATTAALTALSAQVQDESEPVPQNKETLDQVAAIMLQHGTPEQRAEAIAYASSAQVQDVAGKKLEIAVNAMMSTIMSGSIWKLEEALEEIGIVDLLPAAPAKQEGGTNE